MAIINTFSDSTSINTEANEQTLVTTTGGTALNFIMSGSTTNGGNQSVILAGIINGTITDFGSAAQRDQIIILATGFASSITLSGSGNAITNAGSISTDFFSSAVSFSEVFGIFTANEVNRVSNSGLIATTALSSSTYTIQVAAANTAKTYINNSGTILSNASKAISLGDASDSIRNTGTIFGDVRLGGGSNFFDSTTGSVHGSINAGDGSNTIKASNVGNNVTTGSGIDLIWGGTGNDFIDAGGSGDRVHGGNGDDIMIGGAGADTLYGGAGNDSLDGGSDADLLVGAAGDDRYYVTSGDIVNEYSQDGSGHDSITVEGAFNFSLSNTFRVKGLVEDLILEGATGFENINGTGNALDNLIVGNNGNNFLKGLAGDDEVLGGAGNDTLIGGDGLDTLVGGDGDDEYQYYGDEFIDESGTTGRDTIFSFVDIDLEDFLYDFEEDDETPYFGGEIEIIRLGPNGELDASGDLFDNTLNGNGLKNKLNGRGGVDFLNGYSGNDTLTGGADNDRFYFSEALNATSNVDTITDMVHLADDIYIDDAKFIGTFNSGLTLNSGLFRANATGTAGDSNDRIIYKTGTGELFYDSNGSAAGGSVKFAVLTTKPVLSAADFVVF